MERLDHKTLTARIGNRHLKKRLMRQIDLTVKAYSQPSVSLIFHLENLVFLFKGLAWLLRKMGHYERGKRNSVDYQIETIPVAIDRLPTAFHGFRIMQLSDLHADSIIDQGAGLIRLITSLKADICVITGDFRSLIHDVYVPSLIVAGEIIRHIQMPLGIYGVLGNHDFLEFVAPLEESGARILLNESVAIQKGDAAIWLAGVDDAHLYDCHDIGRALKGIPEKCIKILLSHSPKIYRQAAAAGVDYFLCGHTHGGQICLPGGIPVITHAKSPRRFCSGRWRYGRMQGYTSRGTGSSGLPVRFNCRPEITIHELRSCQTNPYIKG